MDRVMRFRSEGSLHTQKTVKIHLPEKPIDILIRLDNSELKVPYNSNWNSETEQLTLGFEHTGDCVNVEIRW
jgi:hypothetical protein